MHVDCHVHVVGELADYPQAEDRTYVAAPAPLEALEGLGAAVGIEGFVIVQPSFYRTDNTLVLESLERLGERGRGVVALDLEETPLAELYRLRDLGVRGIRVNRYSPLRTGAGESLADAVGATAALCGPSDLHVEVIAPLEALVGAADALARAPARLVIDHYGIPGANPPSAPLGAAFLELVGEDHVYVKLSGPYRSSQDPNAIEPPSAWLAALLARAPTRCVFGSDWPHTPAREESSAVVPYRPISYRANLSRFAAAVAEPELLDAVLEANPARLYGFDV